MISLKTPLTKNKIYDQLILLATSITESSYGHSQIWVTHMAQDKVHSILCGTINHKNINQIENLECREIKINTDTWILGSII